MSLFAAASGAADRTIDQVFADRVTVTPFAAANQYRKAGLDLDRPPFDVDAPIVVEDDILSTEGAQENRDFMGRMAAGLIWIGVRMEALAGREIRKGDRITAHARPVGDRTFEVEHAGPTDADGRTKFYLTRVSA